MLDKCVLVVSDLHCGSIFGMLPPGFTASSDVLIQQNPLQHYLWKCWEDYLGRVALIKDKVVAVVLNGDLVDGTQGAQRGTELSLPIPQDQGRAAIAVLAPLRALLDGAPWYATQGTDYHDGPRAGQMLEGVAESLRCLKYGSLVNGSGVFSREFIDLEVDGVILNIAHSIGVSGGLYRTTAPDKEAVWSALAGKAGKMPKADAIIRSHAHYFCHVEHETKHACITPCWQLQTRFMRKNSVYRMLPTLGGVIVWLDGGLKKRGEDPIVIRKIVYDMPPVLTTKVTEATAVSKVAKRPAKF